MVLQRMCLNNNFIHSRIINWSGEFYGFNRRTIFLLLFITTTINSFSQSKQKSDYFVIGEDTTYCVSVHPFRDGLIKSISWMNLQGEKFEISDLINKGVTAFSVNRRKYNLVEVPKGKKLKSKYLWCKVDGTIKLYMEDYNDASWYNSSTGKKNNIHQNMPESESYEKYISIQNQPFIQIRKEKDMTEYLLPVLVECEGYRSKYLGEFTMEELVHILKIYNKYCK